MKIFRLVANATGWLAPKIEALKTKPRVQYTEDQLRAMGGFTLASLRIWDDVGLGDRTDMRVMLVAQQFKRDGRSWTEPARSSRWWRRSSLASARCCARSRRAASASGSMANADIRPLYHCPVGFAVRRSRASRRPRARARRLRTSQCHTSGREGRVHSIIP